MLLLAGYQQGMESDCRQERGKIFCFVSLSLLYLFPMVRGWCKIYRSCR